MKKITLLLSIIIFCLSAKSQVTFNASPTTVTSGSNQQVTLTAVGESNTGYYVTNIGSITTLVEPTVTATIVSISYFNLATFTPTKVVVIFNNNGSVADAIVPQITGDLADVQAGTSNTTTLFVNQGITVNPYPSHPTTYYNTAVSGTFNRQGCGRGTMGSAVTYTVPANKYSSTTSQAAANQLATNDLNANGQNYANAHGQCISVYARLEGYPRTGEGSVVVANFYTDIACTNRFTLPSAVNITITWYKYTYGILNDPTTFGISQVYTVAQGTTGLDIGEREFFPTNPGAPWTGTQGSTVFASVVLQTDNTNFTTEAPHGTFTNN